MISSAFESLHSSNDLALDVKKLLHKLELEAFVIKEELSLSVQQLDTFVTELSSKPTILNERISEIENRILKAKEDLTEIPKTSNSLFPELSKLQLGKDNAAKVHSLFMEEQKWDSFTNEINDLIEAKSYLAASKLMKEIKNDKELITSKEKESFLSQTEGRLKKLYFTKELIIQLKQKETEAVIENFGWLDEAKDQYFDFSASEMFVNWEKISKDNYENFLEGFKTLFKTLIIISKGNEDDGNVIQQCKDYVWSKSISTLRTSLKSSFEAAALTDNFLKLIIDCYLIVLTFTNSDDIANERKILLTPLFELFVPYQKTQYRLEASLFEAFKDISSTNIQSLQLKEAIKKLRSTLQLDDDIMMKKVIFCFEFIKEAIFRSCDFAFAFNLDTVFQSVVAILFREISFLSETILRKCQSSLSLDNFFAATNLFYEFSKLELTIEEDSKFRIDKTLAETQKKDENPAIIVLSENFTMAEADWEGIKVFINEICKKFQKNAFNFILNQIFVDLTGYFKVLAALQPEKEVSSPTIKLPSFNLSPSHLIIKIGEEILSFPQKLEIFTDHPGFKIKYLDIFDDDDESINSWITCLVNSIMKYFMETIEGNGQNYTKSAILQLEVDVDYFINVIHALQVPLISEVELLSKCWEMSAEEIQTYSAKEEVKEMLIKWKSLK